MSLVDDRGRVAGRVNLVDAVAAVVILVLIPVAYGAYLLFQTPPPKLLAIEPSTLYQGPNLRIAIKGANLRPFMRVSFNTSQGRTFLIGSTKDAIVDLPDLAAGTYDIVLFDSMEEVARLPKALTILPLSPTPTISLEVAGSFMNVTDTTAARLTAGTKLPPTGDPVAEIVSVGSPIPASLRIRTGAATLGVPLAKQSEIPATLRVSCAVANSPDGGLPQCQVAGPQGIAVVAPDAYLTLAGPEGWLNFQVSDVHLVTPSTMALARVRLLATPEILSRMKAGDVDTATATLAPGRAATIVALGEARAVTPAEAGTRAPLGPVRVVEATVRVPVEASRGGWAYKGQPFKAGEPFNFETAHYLVRGEVSDVTASDRPALEPSRR